MQRCGSPPSTTMAHRCYKACPCGICLACWGLQLSLWLWHQCALYVRILQARQLNGREERSQIRRPVMWFNSIYLKTLRDFRMAILGWGLGVGLLMFVLLMAIPSVVATPEARAALVSLAGTYAWLAEPIKVDTPGGYATWKY